MQKSALKIIKNKLSLSSSKQYIRVLFRKKYFHIDCIDILFISLNFRFENEESNLSFYLW